MITIIVANKADFMIPVLPIRHLRDEVLENLPALSRNQWLAHSRSSSRVADSSSINAVNFFIRIHNETLTVAAIRVSQRLLLSINSCASTFATEYRFDFRRAMCRLQSRSFAMPQSFIAAGRQFITASDSNRRRGKNGITFTKWRARILLPLRLRRITPLQGRVFPKGLVRRTARIGAACYTCSASCQATHSI